MFAAAAGVAGAAQRADLKLLHSERSLYREVLVYENGRRALHVLHAQVPRRPADVQDTRHPDRIVMNYPQMMLGALFVEPEPQSVLIIGLGGGTLPRALQQLLPDARIDVVEIDPAVVRVARRYFDFGDERQDAASSRADGRVLRQARAARASSATT